MCGIVGCVGHEGATEFVGRGLEALEYRGYDSAGISYADLESDTLRTIKSLGGVSGVVKRLPASASSATTAIGHTRWATHGAVTEANAHPHVNESTTIAVVHNGTIDNHADLRGELQSHGYTFASQTDTEVIPHLLDYYLREGQEPGEAFSSTIKRLVGAYAILAYLSDSPGSIYAARLGSPLVLGTKNSEHFAASDPSIIKGQTEEGIFLGEHEIAELSAEKGYKIRHLYDGTLPTSVPEKLSEIQEKAELGEFPHFMLKEIYDSPETVRAVVSGRVLPHDSLVKLGGLEEKKQKLKEIERLIIVACGTSYHAGLIGERLIEEIAGIPVEVQQASEFKYRDEPIDRNTAVIAISQSGETADTIAAIKKAKKHGLLTIGINNTPGSTIDRDTDAGVHCRAGEEVSVASTKAFTSQVAVLAEVALALSHNGSKLHGPLMKELCALPEKIEEMLKDTSEIEAAAKKYASYKNFLYVGRGYGLASAMEGALKLKEISYIHAEGCGAGEMKHGTLALIDPDFPTFAIATDGSVYEKTISNIGEIRARDGLVIALATAGNTKIKEVVDDVLYVPESLEQTQPILNGIVMQLFAYYIAVEKGLKIDQPRNLAKSVTVE